MPNRFWVGGTNNWNATAGTKWATTSGGAGGAAVPTSADDVFLDAASGVVTVTITVTVNCRHFDSSGFTGTLAGTQPFNIFGNCLIGATTINTFTGNMNFSATALGNTITTNNVSLASQLNFNGVGGGWTLQDNLTTTNNIASQLLNGTLNTNGKTVTMIGLIGSGSSARGLTLGASTIILTGAGTRWSFGTTTLLTFDAGTSTIKFTDSTSSSKTFAGGGLTYNNFWNATTGGGVCIITGSNTFNDFKIDAGGTQKFTAGTTTTLTSLTAIGAGTTITSVTAASHTLQITSGTIAVQNCTISYSTATGGATFNASTALGNVDAGNNLGWNFIFYANQTKNTATFLNLFRHSADTLLSDLANVKFTDVIFSDGTQLKDVTFNQLALQVWSNVNKNTSTFANTSRHQ